MPGTKYSVRVSSFELWYSASEMTLCLWNTWKKVLPCREVNGLCIGTSR